MKERKKNIHSNLERFIKGSPHVAPPRLLILDPRVGASIYMGGCSKYFVFQNPKEPTIARFEGENIWEFFILIFSFFDN
jgi:hypothetical protein